MATVRRLLWAVGLLALLFAPGALHRLDVVDDGGRVDAAALAPTFSTAELARQPTTADVVAAPQPAAPPATTTVPTLVAALAAGVLLLARRPTPVGCPAPVGRRGPPLTSI